MSALTTHSNPRLLIVDDNRSIHDDFRKILASKSPPTGSLAAAEAALFGETAPADAGDTAYFQLDSAYQGGESLDLVRQAVDTGAPYSMAFMDVRMPPGWDGVETTARIWEVDPDLQVVICTAYSDCSWDEMLRKLNRSDRLVILKKPFDRIEVLQLANSLTKKWRLLQDAKAQKNELAKMVEARTRQLVQEQEKLRAIFEYSPDGIFQCAPDGRILSANPALARIHGYASAADLMAKMKGVDLNPGHATEFLRRIESEKVVRSFELEIICPDGSKKWISQTACKVANPDGTAKYYQGFVSDITARKQAEQERNLMEIQLRQSQKLESVGQLAAGIAHEINTPIQYVGDNIRFLQDAFADLAQLLAAEQKVTAACRAGAVPPEQLAALDTARQKTDLPYLAAEIPGSIQQSLDGVGRVANIVAAMKEFSHPGTTEKVPLDLNHAIQTTLTVARNEWKYVAEVVTDFDPQLPKVLCQPGEFNQVILNLVINAAHAIGDIVKPRNDGTLGTIRIRTRRDGNWVEIRVADTGAGIPAEIQHRIFEPFFTTKGVGKGTGQGLAIARSTIVKKHGGQLAFETAPGQGTTFIVRLPVNPPATGPST